MHDILQNDKYIDDDIKLSSREVAVMLEISRHADLLRKIEKMNTFLTNAKMCSLDYWVQTTYLDAKGEQRKEYLISKKGCKLLAHKTSGKKGVLFTIKYIDKFNAMEEALTNPKTTTDPIEQAMQWIKAEEEKRALQKLNETKYL